MNSPKQNRPPKYSGILWLQVTTLPVTKYPPVPFSPFLLLFVFRPITNLPRKDRKGKSEAKYTVRQSSNEPRKIPHITKRGAHFTPRRRQITARTHEEWRKKCGEERPGPTTFTEHLCRAY